MRNKKGGARFSESTAHAGRPFIRSYGRVWGLISRLLYRLLRFHPVTNLANTSDRHLESEFYRLAVTGIANRDGLYLTVAVNVDVNAGDNVVGKQVNEFG